MERQRFNKKDASRTLLAALTIAGSLLPVTAHASESTVPMECSGPSHTIVFDNGVTIGGCASSDQERINQDFRKAPTTEQCASNRTATIADRIHLEKEAITRCLNTDPNDDELRTFIMETAGDRDLSEFIVYVEVTTPDGQSMGGSASAKNATGGNSFSRNGR